jgi:biopolymer transport protein TolQ
MHLFGNNAVWQLVKQADTVTWTILGLLLCLSIISWALFCTKAIVLAMKKRQLQRARSFIMQAKTVEDLRVLATKLSGTLPGYFIAKNLLFFKTHLEQSSHDGSYERKRHLVELMQHHQQQLMDQLFTLHESHISFFSTTAAVAPLLGLLGTVWGLIHSFMRMSAFKSADIATVAPGMAEALIVTLAGLLVAIPALVMCNYLINQVKGLDQHLEVFAQKLDHVITHVIIR